MFNRTNPGNSIIVPPNSPEKKPVPKNDGRPSIKGLYLDLQLVKTAVTPTTELDGDATPSRFGTKH